MRVHQENGNSLPPSPRPQSLATTSPGFTGAPVVSFLNLKTYRNVIRETESDTVTTAETLGSKIGRANE